MSHQPRGSGFTGVGARRLDVPKLTPPLSSVEPPTEAPVDEIAPKRKSLREILHERSVRGVK
jgi:hypothetical protein